MGANRALLPAAAIAAALVAVPALAPAAVSRSSKHADVRVAVEDNFFSARSVTVERGETVKWVWKGENRHNLAFRKVPKGTSERGSRTKRSGKWTRTFWRPGRYSYVCTLFAGMRGEVTVAEPAEESRDGVAGAVPSLPEGPVPPVLHEIPLRKG
jgi:plastocyanin